MSLDTTENKRLSDENGRLSDENGRLSDENKEKETKILELKRLLREAYDNFENTVNSSFEYLKTDLAQVPVTYSYMNEWGNNTHDITGMTEAKFSMEVFTNEFEENMSSFKYVIENLDMED